MCELFLGILFLFTFYLFWFFIWFSFCPVVTMRSSFIYCLNCPAATGFPFNLHILLVFLLYFVDYSKNRTIKGCSFNQSDTHTQTSPEEIKKKIFHLFLKYRQYSFFFFCISCCISCLFSLKISFFFVWVIILSLTTWSGNGFNSFKNFLLLFVLMLCDVELYK